MILLALDALNYLKILKIDFILQYMSKFEWMFKNSKIKGGSGNHDGFFCLFSRAI